MCGNSSTCSLLKNITLAKPTPLNLSRRERQLIEAIYRLEEASVSDVRAGIEDPPSYSAVRALLQELVRKKQLTFRQDGKRYLYRPKKPRDGVARRLLSNLVRNFFQGNPSEAICALLDEADITDEQLVAIKERIARAEEQR